MRKLRRRIWSARQQQRLLRDELRHQQFVHGVGLVTWACRQVQHVAGQRQRRDARQQHSHGHDGVGDQRIGAAVPRDFAPVLLQLVPSRVEAGALLVQVLVERRLRLDHLAAVRLNLAAVQKAVPANEDVVFLGWEPHPMNKMVEMEYLAGGDEVFGPNFGGATVHTNVRAGYTTECPNVGKFLTNLVFSLDMENEIMGAILNDGEEPKSAATAWLKKNPDAVTPWIAGVTTFDGGDAAAAVKTALGG